MNPMSADADIRETASRAAYLLKDRLPALVMTGAGMSVESSIPPFRGPGGLWSKYDPMEYGHVDTLHSDPEKAWILLWDIMGTSAKASPNRAHISLARMEEKGWIGPIITQNVDGLHLIAGSKDVLELHGNIRRIRCMKCGRREVLDTDRMEEFSEKCECGGWKRPEIVFFGESLPEDVFVRSLGEASRTRSLIIIGTSGIVYPAAVIPEQVRSRGMKVVEINPRTTAYTDRISDIFIRAPATLGVCALEEALTDLMVNHNPK
jgi:NAD-dependent deacetylase